MRRISLLIALLLWSSAALAQNTTCSTHECLTLKGGPLRFEGILRGGIVHTWPPTITTYTLLWPAVQHAGALTNDGSGNLSWAPGSGTGTSAVGPAGTLQTSDGAAGLDAYAGMSCTNSVLTAFSATGQGGCTQVTFPALAAATYTNDTTLAANSSTLLTTEHAVKTYVDSVAFTGLSWKGATVAATTTAGTLATSFANGQVLDGVTLATNDRILIKNQATASQNGVYTVAASGAPTRVTDIDISSEFNGATVLVIGGTVNASSVWTQTTLNPTVGTDAITWVAVSSGTVYVAGSGLTLTGNSFAVDTSVVRTTRTLTIAGTANEVTSSAGAQDLSANQTWTLSLPTALNLSGKKLQGASPLVFEGLSVNSFTTTLAVTDPTANRTVTVPNETGTLCTTGSVCSGYQAAITGSPVTGTGTQNILPKWASGGTSLSNSNLSDSGTLLTAATPLRLNGSTSGGVTLTAADTTTSYTFKWPSTQASADQCLHNDGAGNGSWSTCSYNTIQDEGAALAQRQVLNFVGAGVTCVDDGAGTRTTCTITGVSGGGITGTGTTGTIPVWSSSSALSNSGLTDDGSVLTVARGYRGKVAGKSSNYTFATSDYQINCTAGSGGITGTLPSASGLTGQQYRVYKVDSGVGACIIAPNGSDTLNTRNAALDTLTAKSAGYEITQISNTEWSVVSLGPLTIGDTINSGTDYSVLTINTGGVLGQVPPDADGKVLTLVAGAPAWATSSSGAGTVNSGTSGRVAYYASTGTAVSGSSGLTVGASAVRTAVLDNSTSGTITLQTVTGALGTRTISFPAETGTVCTTGSVCSGYQATLTSPVTGSGTTGTIPLWSSSSALGNSGLTDDGSVLTVARGYRGKVAAKSANFTFATSDYQIDCTAGSGGIIGTLPSASGLTGQQYRIYHVDAGAGACTIAPNGSDTINTANASVTDLTAKSAGYEITQISNTEWSVASLGPLALGDTLSGGTANRVLYVGTGPVLAQTTGGTDTQVLTLVAGVPAWADASGGGGVSIGDTIGSGTAGSVLYLGASGVLAQDPTHLSWTPGATGGLTVALHAGFGALATPQWDPSYYNTVAIYENFAGDYGQAIGLSNYATFTPSGSGYHALYGIDMGMFSAGSARLDTIVGGNFVAEHDGDNAPGPDGIYISGIFGEAGNFGSTPVLWLQGVFGNVHNSGTAIDGAAFRARPGSGGGTLTNYYGVWLPDATSAATNSYAFWSDSPGVYRVKADGVMAYYNPSFAKYTPGAKAFERVVQQWESDVLEYGLENGPTQTLTSLTSASTTATATLAGHGYRTGDSVTIAGASPSAYNGTYTVTVTSSSTFTYTFAGGTSPATGTKTAQSGTLRNLRLLGTMVEVGTLSSPDTNTKFGVAGQAEVQGRFLVYDTLSNTVIGTSTTGAALTTGQKNELLGNYAGNLLTTGDKNTAMGDSALAQLVNGNYNTALGEQAGGQITDGGANVALGHLAMGQSNVSAHVNYTIALGAFATTTADNQAVIGGDDTAGHGGITHTYIGQGVTLASPTGTTIHATGGSGTNNAGGALTLAGGQSTGSTAGGAIILQTSTAGGSGTTLRSLVTTLTIDGNQHVITAGTAPAVSNTSSNSCGTTAATIAGTDHAGKVTVGATAGTSCTVTFAKAFTTAPACTVTNETTANLLRATSTTSTVILAGTMVASDKLSYVCLGY